MRSAFVALTILAVLTVQSALACVYVSATDVDVSPPEIIPKWIPEHYDDLCGYFVPSGYFSNIFELDAFYRWKYPDIYDSRFINLACKSVSKEKGCEVDWEFMRWYWDNTEEVRKWLREKWSYPRDWREIIPVSKMLYFEGGETVDALDDDIALTKEVLDRAKQKYGDKEVTASASSVSSVTHVEVTEEGIPTFYNNLIKKYSYIRELAEESLSNPVTWVFTGTVALIVAVLCSNALAVAILVYSSRVSRPKQNYRFFRRL